MEDTAKVCFDMATVANANLFVLCVSVMPDKLCWFLILPGLFFGSSASQWLTSAPPGPPWWTSACLPCHGGLQSHLCCCGGHLLCSSIDEVVFSPFFSACTPLATCTTWPLTLPAPHWPPRLPPSPIFLRLHGPGPPPHPPVKHE